MQMTNSIEILNICRICMCKSELRSLFTYSKKKFVNIMTLSDMVMECTSVCVSENDNLPQKICQKCVYTVNQFYKFREKAKSSDIKFREYLKYKNSNKFEVKAKTETNENDEKEDFKVLKEEVVDYFESVIDSTAVVDDLNIFNNENTDLIHNDIKIEKEIEDSEDGDMQLFEKPRPLIKKTKIESTTRAKVKKKKTSNILQKMKTSSLNRIKKVPNSKPQTCHICGKYFNCRSKLTRHMTTHNDERPFSCSICGKCFKRRENLRNHQFIHTGERRFKCSICGKTFTQKINLIDHIRCHTGEKSQICNVCGKGFSRISSLIYHMRVHTGEKPHKCKYCEKSFSRPGNLKVHIRFHTDERPFQCTICSQRFVTSSCLNTHLKYHRGERDHACSVCNKAFVRKDHLSRHMRTHTNDRPFECLFCSKKFTQKGHMRGHMKIQHKYILEREVTKPRKTNSDEQV